MKKIIKLMMVGLVVVALTVGCSAEDTEEKEEATTNVEDEVVEEVEAEPELEELKDDERALFNTPVEELDQLTYDELNQMATIIGHSAEYTDEDKELINKNASEIGDEFDRKLAEKEEQEAKEKAEQEAKEEEERKRKEQEEKERAEQEAKEEAEKYETGITYEDMARDKSGRIGEYVKFSGKVIQVIVGDQENQYRLATNGDYDDVILIEINHQKLEQNILEDDQITIEGLSVGNITYETVRGDTREIPFVLVENLYQ